MTAAPTGRPDRTARIGLVADTAIGLLASRGLRGLTHRAVDEAAGLPQGSTSNLARTRAALLATAVRRLAEREARVFGLAGPTGHDGPTGLAALAGHGGPATGPEAAAEVIATALHRALTDHRDLLIARYELALEATRRPELREKYDSAGAAFREPVAELLRAAGSPAPERHTLAVVAWCDGVLFACSAGPYHAVVPTVAELRDGLTELLRGMLPAGR
ncbi:TetR/AcrR family transcriptional regulator [Streptomyces pactum]|uniref:TetR/AcrR family transcriptional regulator n=1 Tax=Streptomyces pactum TaxID=68249 RepID=A0ABS0NF00_9ACTN|nr:TetR/AcrR family transcriptional regulator [Streptomyces pactum]MBH5333723.1 TetR/AcrR family transcriptional regulator [Streptomyces pactum]